MADRRHLRPVGDDERVDDPDAGNLQVVLSDLEVAHGYTVEAMAEARACAGPPVEVLDAVSVAMHAVQRAIDHVHVERRKP